MAVRTNSRRRQRERKARCVACGTLRHHDDLIFSDPNDFNPVCLDGC